LVGSTLNDIHDRGAPMGAGRDIKENHLVGPLFVVTKGQLDRVPDIPEFARFGSAELDAAGDLAAVHVQARDDSSGQHAVFLKEPPAH
jgi:hypothetical protein